MTNDTQAPATTDGFHLVIEALKLNGIDTVYGLPGIPITDLIPADRIEAINDRTRKGGAEIVALLKTGSAYYAPGASVAQMVESIVKDQRRILPTCALLEGEYGLKDTWQGVPALLGKNGIEKIFELKLTADEKKLLETSNEHVAGAIQQAAKLLGMEKVPSVRLSSMTAAQKRAYVLADNKLALNAGWDEEILAEELKELLAVDLDFDIGLTGFTVAEIDSLVDGLEPEEPGDPEEDVRGDRLALAGVVERDQLGPQDVVRERHAGARPARG